MDGARFQSVFSYPRLGLGDKLSLGAVFGGYACTGGFDCPVGGHQVVVGMDLPDEVRDSLRSPWGPEAAQIATSHFRGGREVRLR